MKRLFKFKFPKILILCIVIILSYFIFRNPLVSDYLSGLGNLKYLGVFIGGILLAFGFTSPLAVGLFIIINPSNIWLAGIIGGFGALISDLLIFKFIRIIFQDEFNRLKRTQALKNIEKLITNSLGKRMKVYLMYVFAGILIASPLPDEIGVIMLAGLTKIKTVPLAILSFFLHTLGILIILLI